jgi:hypothetical protein
LLPTVPNRHKCEDFGREKIGFQVGHKGLKIGGNENVFINAFSREPISQLAGKAGS